MSKHDFGPFGIIGYLIFPGHDFLFGVLDGIFFVIPLFFSGACFFVFGFFVLPAILNKKFDGNFLSSSKGGTWIGMKSAAFPAYHYYRARDYAQAIISERKAQRIFNHSSAAFRGQVGKSTIVMCHLLVLSERFFAAGLIFVFLAELFGF